MYAGGSPTSPEVLIDGDGARGPSPMDCLLLSLAACMGIDVQGILEKSRVSPEGMRIEVIGERADDHPRRFTKIRLVYELPRGVEGDDTKIARAIQLSRDKYCSVIHSLRPDIQIETEVHRG